MKIISEKIYLTTKGYTDIVDITGEIQTILKKTKLANGTVTIFVPGATGALTTMEYEPGLVKDMQNLFKKLIDENSKYNHNARHVDGNATSHLRASLIGPSLSVPFKENKFQLGTWQQIVFIDFDNRKRKREILVQIIGE